MNQKYLVATIGLCLTFIVSCNSINEASLLPASPTNSAMVATANPLATKAGLAVLEAGGSAVDAAIAIEAVLSLVEPQSSGLAGGAFMVHYDAQTKVVTAYDGRETAPASATPDMFIDKSTGKPFGYILAKNSGISTGVPGIIAMLQLAHEDHGKLEWSELFSDAKTLATDGFEISPRLHGMISRFSRFIPQTIEEGPTDAAQYFLDDEGQAHPAGHVLKNPEYAAALDVIAADPNSFYNGEIADEIVAMVQRSPRASGMTKQDIQNYRPLKRQAMCHDYRDLILCGPPPASSWLAVAQIMSLLENGPAFVAGGADNPVNWSLFAQAQQLAYADRDHFVADPAFVNMPLEGMLNKDYIKQRAESISTTTVSGKAARGNPWSFEKSASSNYGIDATEDSPGTSHFVIVDQQGDVVSITATVESIFGSTRMVRGMFLNNQLTDFSRIPLDDEGVKIANSVEPGKRPRSSMSPTIVLNKDREFYMATGSPGGNNIIAYTAKTLVGVIDWGLTPQQAIELPNVIARGEKVRAEKDRTSLELVNALKEAGFNVDNSRGENSGISMVLRQPDGTLIGGVDPRREGVVAEIKK